MTPREKVKNLYIAVNEMLSFLGAEGEIYSDNVLTEEAMDKLHNIDNGEYLQGDQLEAMLDELFKVEPYVDPNQLTLFAEEE